MDETKMVLDGSVGNSGNDSFSFVGGEVVMRLWNWLLPPLFGWRSLGFWQASACWPSAGSFRRPRRPRPRQHRGWKFRRSLPPHVPEEREKFRRAMDEGYGFATAGGEK